MADIELPQLGESVTEGTITQWFKAVGDEVAEDEPLFEVSTDKVDSEVPSPASGYLTEILVEEGDTVDVGTRIAVVSASPPGEGGDDGAEAPEEPADTDDGVDDEAEGQEPEAPDSEPEPASAGGDAPDEPSAETATAEEPAPAPETEASGQPESARTPEPPTSSEPAPSSGGPVLSPVVRRLLDEAGVDPAEVTGTGVGGRITRADAEQHVRSSAPSSSSAPSPAPASTGPSRPAATAATPPPPPSRVTAAAAAAVGSERSVPLNKIRKITAEHMVRSLETSAHAYVSTEVDYEAVDRVRKGVKDQFRADEGVSLTFLPFVARALVDALEEYPQVNASMGEDTSQLVVHGSVHLGIAVDLDHEGLIVPVVHDAQDQRLRALARNVADQAAKARNRKLSADDITGGTVTITNVGSTGNVFLLPVINQPQVMILSTDGVKRRPVVVTADDGSESIAIRSVGNLTLGWDHRAFDGAYAAQFLARLKEILETRDWAAEL